MPSLSPGRRPPSSRVDPDYQRRGDGQRLYTTLEERARARGYRRPSSTPWRNGPRLAGFTRRPDSKK
ncbi:GNAT family N-acetyltransferase [Natrinema sp. LN54]|uniref:GNAT family N-acetyltransferase n=1 Tax=Natrinema sp. LN54 TaxID=3458705 RepID=UPI004036DCA7